MCHKVPCLEVDDLGELGPGFNAEAVRTVGALVIRIGLGAFSCIAIIRNTKKSLSLSLSLSRCIQRV